MTSFSKQKGTAFERQVVKILRSHRIEAVRAWGSDGRSKGWDEKVDLVFAQRILAQLKIRKRLPKVFMPPEGGTCSIIREDRGSPHIVIELVRFISILLREPTMLNSVLYMIDALCSEAETTEPQREILLKLRSLVVSIIPSWYIQAEKAHENTS